MRRVIAVVCTAAVLFVGGAWAVAAARSSHGTEERAIPLTSGITRATRYYGGGPSADYSFDSGTIGMVAPLRLSFPAGTTYDVVVTVSLDYRTSADDRFVVGMSARRDAKFGHLESVSPKKRAISASQARTSTTASFGLSDLQGGHEYWFSPNVNVSHRGGHWASISCNHVLVVVEATPST
jgi:hypothetical protein